MSLFLFDVLWNRAINIIANHIGVDIYFQNELYSMMITTQDFFSTEDLLLNDNISSIDNNEKLTKCLRQTN